MFRATSLVGPVPRRYRVPRKARVRDLLGLVQIAEQEARRVLVNGRWPGLDSALREGDMVEIFP
jgi:molybdopterin converting factor small subunit